MKIFYLLIATLFLFNNLKSQTILYEEDFEDFNNEFLSTTPKFGWVTTENSQCNRSQYWSVYSAAGKSINGQSLMISTKANNCNVLNGDYYNNTASNRIVYTTINAENFENLQLKFNWKCHGESGFFTLYDYGRVVYRIGNTGNWTPLGAYYYNQPTTQNATVNLPTSLNETVFQLGFQWINDGSGGNPPPFIVDNINISGTSTIPCDDVKGIASKYVVCQNETITLSVQSPNPQYTYNWYTNWNANTNSGTLIGTGSSISTTITESVNIRLVGSNPNCSDYDYISIFVSSTPTDINVSPTSVISCSNDIVELSVVDGGIIPEIAFSESFNIGESSIPWITSVAIGGGDPSDAYWSLYAPNSRPGFRSNDNSYFVMVDNNSFTLEHGPYPIISNLISPSFSLQDYSSPIELSFYHHYRYYNGDSGKVQISTDLGATWTTLQTFASTVGASDNFALNTINLDAYAGTPNMILRFNYTAQQDWYWAIDNVKVTGTPAPTTITWSPISGLFTDPTINIPYTGGHATTVYSSPSETTTYTVSASSSIGCPSTNSIVITKGDKQWNGTNSNWANANNWLPNGIPTSNHCVNIPSTSTKPIIPTTYDAFAKSLNISNGGGLTISSNSSLFVKNEIINNGNADDFILQSDANLLQENPLAVNVGPMRAERYVQDMNNILPTHMDYVYWSSPVTGQAIHDGTNSIFSPGTPRNRNYEYRESNDYFYPTPDQTFKKGKGYAIRAETGINPETGQEYVNGYNKTYKFSGIPNNGTITSEEPLIYTDPIHGHNLVGNPYPSNLILQDFLNANSSKIEYLAYFWTNNTPTPYQSGTGYNGNSYAYFNALGGNAAGAGPSGYDMTDIPNGIVKVGQGFLVKAKPAGNNENLVFENNSRSADAGSFYQKNTEDRFWLTLTSPDQMNNMMLIGYNEDATDGFELMFDAPLVTESSDAIYAMLGNQKLAINGLAAPFSRNDIIPIGFKSFKNGVHTIQLFNAEGVFIDHDIFIKDKYRKTIHNLKQSPFEFKSGAGEFNDRFEIVFKRTNISASSSTKSSLADKPGSIIISSKNNAIFASVEKENIIQIDVYDLFGKLLFQSKNINSNTYLTPQQFKNQIVFVNVITGSGLRESKKIIFD